MALEDSMGQKNIVVATFGKYILPHTSKRNSLMCADHSWFYYFIECHFLLQGIFLTQ